ncbi:hypothetical protein SDC9_113260 [bioreactor metagenome]|uniref:Uncharacterized protein n=1 Tax=bioreactor metagenome TaxID=1076179 RepID=A0A645BSY0_9ZZZZ
MIFCYNSFAIFYFTEFGHGFVLVEPGLRDLNVFTAGKQHLVLVQPNVSKDADKWDFVRAKLHPTFDVEPVMLFFHFYENASFTQKYLMSVVVSFFEFNFYPCSFNSFVVVIQPFNSEVVRHSFYQGIQV